MLDMPDEPTLATASFVPPFKDMAETTLFKFNFAALAQVGWFTVVTLVLTFCMIDMFDTIGTLVGTASRAGMVDKDGNMPNMKEALVSDAVGTVAGSLTGTSTITTFVESASGVEAGGRTGLTALTTGILFLACMFIAPIAAIIPAPATSAALIYVGLLMIGGIKKINFDDMTDAIPAFLTILVMPLAYSISEGIAIGVVSWTLINLLSGKAKEKKITPLMYVLTVLFILKYIFL